jgi:hypothetical protein
MTGLPGRALPPDCRGDVLIKADAISGDRRFTDPWEFAVSCSALSAAHAVQKLQCLSP